MAGASLAALERTRGWQADAEVEWLLNQNDVAPHRAAPRFGRSGRRSVCCWYARDSASLAPLSEWRVAGNGPHEGNARDGRLTGAERGCPVLP